MRQSVLARLARLEHMVSVQPLARQLIVLEPDGDGYRELHTGRWYPPGVDPVGDNLVILRVVYGNNKSTHE